MPLVLCASSTVFRTVSCALFCLVTVLGAGGAAGAPAASPAAVEDARQRFRRGVELHEEGDLGGAQAEFARAYELVPSYKILYNLAQIAYQQRDYAAALQRFSRYLRDGGDEIPDSRRRLVEAEIERLQHRIGRLKVSAREPGAQLYVDDLAIGPAASPEPVAVNVGRRKVEIVLPDGDRRVRLVDVPGGETVGVSFERSAPKPATGMTAGAPASSLALGLVQQPGVKSGRRAASSTPWPGWIVSGLLGAGAGVSGGFALSASRTLEQQRNAYPVRYDDLQRAQSDARRWALITDGLLIGTAVAAAVSLYLTLRGD
jgi:hypothetical protein